MSSIVHIIVPECSNSYTECLKKYANNTKCTQSCTFVISDVHIFTQTASNVQHAQITSLLVMQYYQNRRLCIRRRLFTAYENTTDVRNIKQYLLAALYNAPGTISSYYSAKVNHDMYGTH